MTNEPNNNDLLQRNMMAAQYQWQDQKLAGQVIQSLQEQLHFLNSKIARAIFVLSDSRWQVQQSKALEALSILTAAPGESMVESI